MYTEEKKARTYMKPLKKLTLKVLSNIDLNIKKNYKVYRRVLTAISLTQKPIYKTWDHKIITNGREIPVRIFVPSENHSTKILIFFHGGGWVTGNIDSYTNVCTNLANETNHTVISVDYSLAPEHPFPIGVEDCYYATREIFQNSELFNCTRDDITLIGDSAGGNLAAVVSLMARDRNEFIPKKQILIYPATNYDHSENSPYPSVKDNGTDYIMTSQRIQDYMDLYVPKLVDRLSPYVAPLLSDDLSNQPKTLIITSEFDPLRDEGRAYGLKLRKFGNDVTIEMIRDALHGFFSNPLSTIEIAKAMGIIRRFLDVNETMREE